MNNNELNLYGTTIKTETVALIKINNKFEAFSKESLNEMLSYLNNTTHKSNILKLFGETENETIHILNIAIKLIEDKS